MQMLASAIESGAVFELSSDKLTAAMQALEAERVEESEDRKGGTAVIPLQGTITPNGGGFLAMLLGLGGGLRQFRSDLAEALNDDRVDRIVLDINSPGGQIAHVPETAAVIRAAKEIKPITAVANTLAASAAYWLAAQASEIVVTPSGEVGSIGVYMGHVDRSKAIEEMGTKITLISAGKFKTEGNPYEPLSDAGLEHRQARVDGIYSDFLREVALGRGVSVDTARKDFGEGRTMTATEAVDAGMADRVAVLEEVLAADTKDDPEDGTEPESEGTAEDEPPKAEEQADDKTGNDVVDAAFELGLDLRPTPAAD